MKKIKSIAIVLLFSVMCFASSFCDGFKAGYVAGYCYGQEYTCLRPLIPMCPMPRLGERSYMDGYNRGFLMGMSAQ